MYLAIITDFKTGLSRISLRHSEKEKGKEVGVLKNKAALSLTCNHVTKNLGTQIVSNKLVTSSTPCWWYTQKELMRDLLFTGTNMAAMTYRASQGLESMCTW